MLIAQWLGMAFEMPWLVFDAALGCSGWMFCGVRLYAGMLFEAMA